MDEISDELRQSLLDTANEMADAARAAILPHFRTRDLSADNKADGAFDPVTIADRNAEAAMRGVLAARRPDDAIIGEEFGQSPGTSGMTWVLDPVDGTRGFISGTPTWGVLIAVGDARGPILGLIDQPYIGERFLGGLGEAWVDGPMGRTELRCRAPRALSEATLFTTFPEVGTLDEAAAFHALSGRVNLTRYGMDCYAYALITAGQVDLVVEAGLHAYDIQAPIAVIEAAGGVVTDWSGDLVHQGGQVLAAANADIHAEALKVLQDSPA